MSKKIYFLFGIACTLLLSACATADKVADANNANTKASIDQASQKGSTPSSFVSWNREKQNAVQMIHHIVWVLACLNKDLTDSRDLELQYNLLLADNLSYDVMDYETKNFAKHILEYINRLRIDSKERELLAEIYLHEKQKALYACLPSNMAVIVDANWKQLLANVAQTLFYSYMNYKKIKESLAIQYRKDVWALDKQKWNDITTKNLRKLDDMGTILRKNYILDKEIVKNADELYKDVEDVTWNKNKNFNSGLRFKKHSALKSKEYEKKYENFAMYWFYRGIFAYDYIPQTAAKIEIEPVRGSDIIEPVRGSDIKDAKYCFDKFQQLTQRPVLTRDPIVAEVALRQIQLNLVTNRKDNEFIKRQLNLVEQHIAFDKAFDKYLFCGIVYYKYLKDYEAAAEMFKNADRILFSAFKRAVDKKFCEKLSADSEYPFEPDRKDFKITVDDQKLPLPSSDLLFFAKKARYYMTILAKKDQNLADDIRKEITSYDSPLAVFFYGANVKENATKLKYYNEIIPNILRKSEKHNFTEEFLKTNRVGEAGFPYSSYSLIYDSNCWGNDGFYLDLPLAFTYLHNVKIYMEIHKGGKEIKNMPLDKEETKIIVADKKAPTIADITARFYFTQEEDEIPANAEEIVFTIKHDLFDFRITYDIRSRKGKSKNKTYYRNLKGKMSFQLSPKMRDMYASK